LNASADLAARLQRLEDLEAIRRVMSDYAQAGDDRQGYSVNIERAMLLFARDAVWEGRPRFGRYEGWEAVRDSFLRAQARIDWSLHYLVDVGIDLEPGADAAHGRWYLFELARMVNPATGAPEMVTLGGIYDDDLVREDGRWKIKVMRFDCQMIVGPGGAWPLPPGKA
jgi:hypothetical protein